MIAHSASGYSQSNRTVSGAEFHYNAADSHEDFDASRNPGSFGDISVFLATFRAGLRSEPWATRIDPSLIDFVTMPGFAGIAVFYNSLFVGLAHVQDRCNPPRVDVSYLDEEFKAAIGAMLGRVSL